MIKKQQKWIALLVTLTFVWLLQVSTMPVAAANAPAQVSSTNAEQAPSFIEQESGASSQVKKKSILPIILIGVGVVAVAAVLFLVVLKTSYNIVGTWTINYTNAPPFNTFNMVFAGNKTSGTWTLVGYTDTGTYTVDGKNVSIVFNGAPWTFTGKFDDKDKMSGTHVWPALSISGTWTATRQSTTTEIPALQTINFGSSILDKLLNK